MELDSHKLLGVGGDPADCVQEPQNFQKNVALSYYKNNVPLSTHAVANYMRGEKSANLRKGMKVVDMLLAGYDEDVGPSLFFLDYLASMQKLDKGAHGYCGFFCNSLLDAHWKPGMTVDEALQLMQLCAAEMKRRFSIVRATPPVRTLRSTCRPSHRRRRRVCRRALANGAACCSPLAGDAQVEHQNRRQGRHPQVGNAALLRRRRRHCAGPQHRVWPKVDPRVAFLARAALYRTVALSPLRGQTSAAALLYRKKLSLVGGGRSEPRARAKAGHTRRGVWPVRCGVLYVVCACPAPRTRARLGYGSRDGCPAGGLS
jgi:20S proteasome subunit beta 4